MWWVIGFFLLLILFPVALKILPPILSKKSNDYTLLLNTNSLHSQYLFHVLISLPLIISSYLMIWIGSEYPFRLDSIGFNSFLNIQKLPLGILALSPILGAFVVSAHRSIQTTKQIEVTEKKNKVDIYISQRKFIIEQLENIKISYYGEIDNATHVYNIFRKFYNYSDRKITTSFSLINSKLDDIHTSFINVKTCFDNFDKDKPTFDKLNQNLTKIKTGVMLIINSSGIKSNDFKIDNAIENYCDEFNTYIKNKSDNNHDYHRAILNYLLQDIINEMVILHSTLCKLFTIILLDEDISEFLPNLEKISPTQLR